MAIDKAIDSGLLDGALKASADEIRAKTGDSGKIQFDLGGGTGFKAAIAAIQTGGDLPAVEEKEVNFFDYDGILLHSYTIAEAQALTELPGGPVHDGLIFDGWNWTLDEVKSLTYPMDIGAHYITDDGTTRIYITLREGRTSPILGVGVEGTVTVDWGDGTAPDILTGTVVTVVQWTPTHEYEKPGRYVISLKAEGKMRILGSSLDSRGTFLLQHTGAEDYRNRVYTSSIDKVELGAGIDLTSIYSLAFAKSMTSITIPSQLPAFLTGTFIQCSGLKFVTIPRSNIVTQTNFCNNCQLLSRVSLPPQHTDINSSAFYGCQLKKICIPDSVKTIGGSAFPANTSVTHVRLTSALTSVGNGAFLSNYGVHTYDFSACAQVPALVNANAFSGIAADCEIRVPATLYDEWIAATNWTTYADHIVAV